MADEPKQTRVEVEVLGNKVRADGVYEDVRPLIVSTVDGLNSAVKFACNLCGIPFDWANSKLGPFREKLMRKAEAIPEEFIQEPPFKLEYEVLRETVICAEEPTLQEMFANLLGTAADSRTASDAHPGFAKAISQLTPLDAKIIAQLRRGSLSPWYVHHHDICSRIDFEVSQGNLIQLGIAEWEPVRLDSQIATDKFRNVNVKIPRQTGNPNSWSSSMENGKPEGLDDAAKDLVQKLKQQIEKSQKPTSIRLTGYGTLFAKACLDPLPPETSETPQAPRPSP